MPVSPQVDTYLGVAGQRLKVGRRFADTGGGGEPGDGLLWVGTIPAVNFSGGSSAVFSLAPYLTTQPVSYTLRLSLATGYSLPPGVTLDGWGHRLVYDGSGTGIVSVNTRLVADDDPYAVVDAGAGYGVASWLVKEPGDSTQQAADKSYTYATTWNSLLNGLVTWTAGGNFSGINGTTVMPQSLSYPWTEYTLQAIERGLTAGTERDITLNVTTLVQSWDNNSNRMCAMLLTSRDGNNMQYRSRNYIANTTKRPKLRITYADSTVEDIEPIADVTLDGSSVDGMYGLFENLLVTGFARTAMQWHRAAVVKKHITSASLILSCFSSSTATTVGVKVFQLEPPVQGSLPSVTLGLARSQGAALASHPSVIELTDFSAAPWAAASSTPTNIGRYYWQYGINSTPLIRRITWPGSRSGYGVELNIAAGATGGNFGYIFVPLSEELYFQCRMELSGLRIGATLGGKLPGPMAAGEMHHYTGNPHNPYGPGGSNYGEALGAPGYSSDGTNAGHGGWAYRGLYEVPGIPGDSAHKRVGVGVYAYDSLTPYAEGRHDLWTSGQNILHLFEEDREYLVEWRIKLNTPGVADGICQCWVDGRLAFSHIDIVFRIEPYTGPGNLDILAWWLCFYHGGITPYPVEQLTYRFTDMVIATQYIGPP